MYKILLIIILSLMPYQAYAQVLGLENFDLSSSDIVTDEHLKKCNRSEINEIYSPLRIAVSYDENTNVKLLASVYNPDISELTKTQETNSFALAIPDNQTDTYTIIAEWEYTTNPKDGRLFSYEIRSNDATFEYGTMFVNDFYHCRIWVLGVTNPPYVPTLEDYEAQSKEAIIEITASNVLAQTENNELTFLILWAFIVLCIIIIVVIVVTLLFNQEARTRLERTGTKFNKVVKSANNIIISIQTISKHQSYIIDKEIENTHHIFESNRDTMRALIEDFRLLFNYAKETIGLSKEEISKISQLQIIQKTLRPYIEIEDILLHVSQGTRINSKLLKYFKRTKESKIKSLEKYIEKYSNIRKYDVEELNRIYKKIHKFTQDIPLAEREFREEEMKMKAIVHVLKNRSITK